MALHVYNWGKFSHDFKMIRLPEYPRQPLSGLVKEISDAITGPMFFRLSSISSKDVGPPRAENVDELFDALARSDRIQEALEVDERVDLCLRKWDDRIEYKNEYRCFIFGGVCEAIARTDESAPSAEVETLIRWYIEENKKDFPEETLALDVAIYEKEVIFIEFNPIDDELDQFGILKRDTLLSAEAMRCLSREPN